MSEDGAKTTSPVIRISLASAVGQTKQMSFETYVDQVTPVAVMNSLADRIMAVADRQIAKYEIIDLEKLFIKETNLLESQKGDLARIDKSHADKRDAAMSGGQIRSYKLTPQDKQARENVLTNIDNRTKYLEQLRKDIDSRREMVAAGEATA